MIKTCHQTLAYIDFPPAASVLTMVILKYDYTFQHKKIHNIPFMRLRKFFFLQYFGGKLLMHFAF